MSATFSAPYTTTTLVCLMASVECALVGVCIRHDASAWSLGFGIRLIAAIYAVSFSNFLYICTAPTEFMSSGTFVPVK